MGSSTKNNSLFDFKTYVEDRRGLVNSMLDRLLPLKEPTVLSESMRYSVLSSGKRLRALLALASFETILRIRSIEEDSGLDYDCPWEPAIRLACAIEMIHAMSLVHDDLPCLDNDDLRRGKPTNHVVFGEATALLAGDALIMRAIEVLISSSRTSDLPAGIADMERAIIEITEGLCRAAGADGMVGGQIFDLQYTDSPMQLDEKTIGTIHSSKTGALIRFSLWSGARLAQADERQLRALSELGDLIGLAFQIADDLLDVIGDKDILGKTPGKDKAANKATWVSLFGVEGAQEKLTELEIQGKLLLRNAGLASPNWPILEALLESSIHRNS